MKSLVRVLVFAFVFLSPFAIAEEWNPEPPVPEKWDWIQLVSGEWLKGEIIVLYNDTLEFESDELDVLSFDIADITKIRSGNKLQIKFTGNLTKSGKVIVDGDKLQFKDSADVFKTSDILTIIAGEPKESNYWTMKFTMGANVRSGNTEQTDINANIKAQRRTVENRMIVEYLANYSKTQEIETTNNQRASAAWDKFLTERLFLRPVFGEYLSDSFQNINSKYTVGTGVGYQIIDNSRVEWLVVGGPAYQSTEFETVEEGLNNVEETPAFVGTSNFDVEIINGIDFIYDYQFTLLNEASGTYIHHMLTGLEIELTSLLDLDLSVVCDRTENPKTNSEGDTPKPDDYRFIVGVGFKF